MRCCSSQGGPKETGDRRQSGAAWMPPTLEIRWSPLLAEPVPHCSAGRCSRHTPTACPTSACARVGRDSTPEARPVARLINRSVSHVLQLRILTKSVELFAAYLFLLACAFAGAGLAAPPTGSTPGPAIPRASPFHAQTRTPALISSSPTRSCRSPTWSCSPCRLATLRIGTTPRGTELSDDSRMTPTLRHLKSFSI